MKSDEDVWISGGTTASLPDKFGPDGGSRGTSSSEGAARPGSEGGGELKTKCDSLQVWPRDCAPWPSGWKGAGRWFRVSQCHLAGQQLPDLPPVFRVPRDSLCEQNGGEDMELMSKGRVGSCGAAPPFQR